MLGKIQGVLLLATVASPIAGYAMDKYTPLKQVSTQNTFQLKNDIEPRIVGGEEATPFSYPFMGSLHLGDMHWCGLSFIGDNKVLTASHCVEDQPASAFSVKFEGHDLTDESQWQTYQVTRIVMHEQYNFHYQYNNDIAILELDRPVENITPIKLADPQVRNSITSGENLKVMGWGRLSSGGESPTKLQEVDVPYVSNEICNDSTHYNGEISNTMMCAGLEDGGKDSCQGDSGGPLIVQRNNEWVQVGVVSWGAGCALPNKPGVYADVASLLLWTHTKLIDFGFNSESITAVIPDQPSAQIQGTFKNTLDYAISISDFVLQNGSSNVELIGQNCANATLAPDQGCDFTVRVPDEQMYGNYDISVTITAPSESVLTGNFSFHKVTNTLENVTEHMSTSPKIQWLTGGDEAWKTDITDSGEHVLVSGDISDRAENPDITVDTQTTYLVAEINDPHITELSFDYLISSEQNFDFLTVHHNGKNLVDISGQLSTFQNVKVNLVEGINRILFKYKKDASISTGTDNVTLKNISTDFVNASPQIVVEQSEINTRSELEFALDASQSLDPDQDQISYQWVDLDNVETVLGEEATLTLQAEKVAFDTTRTYQVTVTDEHGAASSAQVTVNIATNKAPVIMFAQDEINVRSEAEFTLDASPSTDPEGDAITYSWVKLSAQDEVVGDTASVAVKADKALQDLTVIYQLTATDSFGASTTELLKVNISKNNAPVATLASETQSASIGDEVVIIATSTDPDGDGMVYSWAQKSGTAVDLPGDDGQLVFIAPTVTQDETLEFTFTVTDSFGLSHSQSISITVKAPAAKGDDNKTEPTPTQTLDQDNGSSGSFGIISLFMFSLVGFRRFMTK
ncbi:serine protease [Pseudoalteromonas obscura]|uniref:Trypsin-like serine protease n=1 Tax=Pseudoalteromonas obscura TaxID=3048491 RepID=A0ABT7EGT4_9GAMM|nr:trypsin-like serine protease [Pseudoalteromonas sp. P94(2023)]MDK2594255.1 trypsin-like serine protease [Pseudoalteromonas sp. P94(2023)]